MVENSFLEARYILLALIRTLIIELNLFDRNLIPFDNLHEKWLSFEVAVAEDQQGLHRPDYLGAHSSETKDKAN